MNRRRRSYRKFITSLPKRQSDTKIESEHESELEYKTDTKLEHVIELEKNL